MSDSKNKLNPIHDTSKTLAKILNHTWSYIRHRGVYSSMVFLLNAVIEWIWFVSHRNSSVNPIKLNPIEAGLDNKKHSTFYLPTPIIPFRKLMKKLSPLNDFVFVDYGAGKGRSMILAQEFGFAKVKGLEFSLSLYNSAQKNIQNHIKKRGKANFELLNRDVSAYTVKKEDNFFYFFNPFNDFILTQCLNNIHASLKKDPRKAFLIYQINQRDNTNLITEKSFFKLKEIFTSFGTSFYVYEHSPLISP